MTTLGTVVEGTNQCVRTIRPDASLMDAVEAMCRFHVRALVVGELENPVGIISERDVLERGVLARRAPDTTRVADVMTTPLVWLPVECPPGEALEFMRVRHLHQVPVMSAEAVVGVVSLPDLMKWARRDTEVELQSLTEYCCLRYPG